MFARHFNALKENQTIIHFLMPVFIYFENKRNVLV